MFALGKTYKDTGQKHYIHFLRQGKEPANPHTNNKKNHDITTPYYYQFINSSKYIFQCIIPIAIYLNQKLNSHSGKSMLTSLNSCTVYARTFDDNI